MPATMPPEQPGHLSPSRMLASLPEIIFSVTQTKLLDEVMVLAVCSSSFILKDRTYPMFSCG